MQSKEYGRRAVAGIASRLADTELRLDYEKPKPVLLTTMFGLLHDDTFQKLEAEIILPKSMVKELASVKYGDIADMLADRCALDVLELAEQGDTTSTDQYLATFDGALKVGATTGQIEFSDNALLEILGNGDAGGARIKLTMHLRAVWPQQPRLVA